MMEKSHSVSWSIAHSHIVDMGYVSIVVFQYAPFSALRLVGASVL